MDAAATPDSAEPIPLPLTPVVVTQEAAEEGDRARAALSHLQLNLEAAVAARDAAVRRAEAAEQARELARLELTAKTSLAEAEAAIKCAPDPAPHLQHTAGGGGDTLSTHPNGSASVAISVCHLKVESFIDCLPFCGNAPSRFEAASRVVRSRFESRAMELGLEVDSWKSFVSAQGLGFPPPQLLLADGSAGADAGTADKDRAAELERERREWDREREREREQEQEKEQQREQQREREWAQERERVQQREQERELQREQERGRERARASALEAALEALLGSLHPRVPGSPADAATLLKGTDPQATRAVAEAVGASITAALAASGRAEQLASTLKSKLAETRGAVREAEARAVGGASAAAAKVASWGAEAQAQLDGAYSRADQAEARVKVRGSLRRPPHAALCVSATIPVRASHLIQ